MWFVYILRCSDGNLYTGCTSDIDERLVRHNSGQVAATQSRLPLTLITYIAFADKYKAFKFEKYLKGGSGRAFHFIDKLRGLAFIKGLRAPTLKLQRKRSGEARHCLP